MLEISSRSGVQIIVTILLARLLNPSDFGLIAMVLVFTAIGTMLVDSGLESALVQRREITPEDETTAFAVTLIFGVIIGAVVWLIAPSIAAFYQQPELISLTHLVVWVLPFGALAVVPSALLTRRLDFRSRARAELVASGTAGMVAVILAWREFGVWSIGWQVVLAAGLRAGLLWRYSGWRPYGHVKVHAFRRLFGFGSYLLLSQLLDTFFMRLQALLLGRLFGVTTLGYYTLAQTSQQAPTTVMERILNRVGLPVFSTVADDPVKFRGGLRMTLRASIFVFFPCMVGLAILAKPLIILVFGAQWEPAAPMLSLLALAAALWPLNVLNLVALTASGRSDRLFRLEVIKKTLAISLVILASPYGPVAVAGAVLASSLAAVVANTWYSGLMFGYKLGPQLADQRLTVVLCLISALPAWGVLHWAGGGALPIVSAIALAMVTYVIGAIIFRSPGLLDIIDLWSSVITSR